jgi:hypothetical protein
MKPLPSRQPKLHPALPIAAAALFAAIGVLVLGAYPGPLLEAANHVIASIVR